MKSRMLLAVLVFCGSVFIGSATSAQAPKKKAPPKKEGQYVLPKTLPALETEAGLHRAEMRPNGVRESLRWSYHIPAGYAKGQERPVVIALHYGGEVTPHYGAGLIESLVGPAFKDLGAVIVAPDSRGGDWTTPANEELVVWLATTFVKFHKLDSRKVVLTGYSMGGNGTWYLGSRHQDLFAAAIPVASEKVIGDEWKIPLFIVHGKKDEVFPVAPLRSGVEKLEKVAANVEFLEIPNFTHYQTVEYAPHVSKAVPWLKEQWKEAPTASRRADAD